MPLCPAGLKLCEQSGFLGEIYFLCRLQAASPAERMSLSLRGHCSLLQPALGFYFIFEGIRTIKETQTDIFCQLQNTGAHTCVHTSTLATCSSAAPRALLSHRPGSAHPTPQHRNPTRNPRPEPGGRSHSPHPASAPAAGAVPAPVPPDAAGAGAAAGHRPGVSDPEPGRGAAGSGCEGGRTGCAGCRRRQRRSGWSRSSCCRVCCAGAGTPSSTAASALLRTSSCQAEDGMASISSARKLSVLRCLPSLPPSVPSACTGCASGEEGSPEPQGGPQTKPWRSLPWAAASTGGYPGGSAPPRPTGSCRGTERCLGWSNLRCLERSPRSRHGRSGV